MRGLARWLKFARMAQPGPPELQQAVEGAARDMFTKVAAFVEGELAGLALPD